MLFFFGKITGTDRMGLEGRNESEVFFTKVNEN